MSHPLRGLPLVLLLALPLSVPAAEPDPATLAASADQCAALLDRLESGEDTIETAHELGRALESPLSDDFRARVLVPRLLVMLRSPHAKVRAMAHGLLGTQSGSLPDDAIAELFRNDDATIRLLAVDLLRSPADGDSEARRRTVERLLPLLDDPSDTVANAAARRLRDLDPELSDPAIRVPLQRHDARVIEEALAEGPPSMTTLWKLEQIASRHVLPAREQLTIAPADMDPVRLELLRQCARVAFHVTRRAAAELNEDDLSLEGAMIRAGKLDWGSLMAGVLMELEHSGHADVERRALFSAMPRTGDPAEALWHIDRYWPQMLARPPLNLTREELGLPAE